MKNPGDEIVLFVEEKELAKINDYVKNCLIKISLDKVVFEEKDSTKEIKIQLGKK